MTPTRPAVPLDRAPAEALRLLDELAGALRAEAGDDPEGAVRPLRDAARSGTLDGALMVGPKDDAVGIAWWEPPSEVGRRIGLYLAPGYRSRAALSAFLDALEGVAGGPVVEVADRIPGVAPGDRTEVLTRRGFVPVSRVDLVWPAGRPLPAIGPVDGGVVRPLGPTDAGPLAELLDRAYADNPVDRALFRQRRESRADARDAVDLLLSGRLGPWLQPASLGVEAEGRLLAAVVVNDFHGALITEVMVDPAARRRGWARRLLAEALAHLTAAGRNDIRLAVTLGNEPAYRLYDSLGFVPRPVTEGSTWLHAGHLGLPVPGPR